MGIPAGAGRLLGSGRTADVYALDGHDGHDDHDGQGGLDDRDGLGDGLGGGAWVLRRYRDGYGDAQAEAAVMEYVRGHGYPVPRVRAADAPPTS
ncbi:phosphotransferase [Streptomyces sp. NPDC057199]|uniref:phosphotransferase n=1 Tax=Streptomyces sp. NPDC057199 TaxID=3346047 RepID=UPI0036349B41